MRDRKPVKPATQTMSASKTRQHFSDVVNREIRAAFRGVPLQ
jgi:hypothetical protein